MLFLDRNVDMKKYLSFLTFSLFSSASVLQAGYIKLVEDSLVSDSEDAQGIKKRISFPGEYKLADTLKEKRLQTKPLSLSEKNEVIEVQGDGFNYYCSVLREEMKEFDGTSLIFKADLMTGTPGAYIEYWDGLKEVMSKPHTGSGMWESLDVEFIVDAQKGRWFNFYPAILSAVEGAKNPSVKIKNITILSKKAIIQHKNFKEPSLLRLNLELDMEPNAVFPTGWNLAQNKNSQSKPPVLIKKSGSIEIQGNAYNFYRSCSQLSLYDDQSFVFKVNMKSNTPGAYIEFWAGKTEFKSSPHTGGGQWETLNVEFKVDTKNSSFFMLYPVVLSETKGNLTPSVEIKNLEIQPKDKIAFDKVTKRVMEERSILNKEKEKILTKIFGEEDDSKIIPEGEIAKFYLNQRRTPSSNLSLDEVHLMTWDELELNHDYIQLIFPLRTQSGSVKQAPVITKAEEFQFKQSRLLQRRMIKSLMVMLDFYGLELDLNSGVIQKASHFALRAPQYLTPANHNYLRITRILGALNLCDLGQYSHSFFNCLAKIYEDNKDKITLKTFSFWKNASKIN